MQDSDAPQAVPINLKGRTSYQCNASPTVSLVIPCYTTDRWEDLCRLIDSVERQEPPIDQLLIVVQQSRELKSLLSTRLTSLTAGMVKLIFLDTEPAVSRARNAGVCESFSDIVAFVDDDAVLADDWSDATRSFYRSHPDAIGVAGAIMPLWDSSAMEWFPRELYWMLSCTYWTAMSPVPVRNGYGANMSFRREAFGGGERFNESLGIAGWGKGGWRGMGGEEPELSLRVTAKMGRSVLYVPDIRAWHRVRPHRLSPKSLLRRAYWEGRLKAALSGSPHKPPNVLDTERALLKSIVRAHGERIRLFGSRPVWALKQELTVFTVVLTVALGFAEGRLRRSRLIAINKTFEAVGR